MTMMEVMLEFQRTYPKVEYEGQGPYNPYPTHWVEVGLQVVCKHMSL